MMMKIAKMPVNTLVFDEAQITSPINGNNPQWGGVATLYQKSADALM